MFSFSSSRTGTTCDGASRRDFLRVGALGLGGLMLPDLLRARAAEIERDIGEYDLRSPRNREAHRLACCRNHAHDPSFLAGG